MSDELYWHFATVAEGGKPRLGYDDGREIVMGETLRVDGEPVLCEQGLHASRRLFDALGYAPSNTLVLCRVTLGGSVKHDNNKSVGNERAVVAMLTMEETDKLLRDFARWCALQVIHLWDAPDVVRQYLETGDESLRDAARSAARAAAGVAAAWAAARAAARDAARAAAVDAAVDAARAAAVDAAAWAAARAAASLEYATELERRGLEAIENSKQQEATNE